MLKIKTEVAIKMNWIVIKMHPMAGVPRIIKYCTVPCGLRLFKWFLIILFCIKENIGGILAAKMFISPNVAFVSVKPFEFYPFFFWLAPSIVLICVDFLGGI